MKEAGEEELRAVLNIIQPDIAFDLNKVLDSLITATHPRTYSLVGSPHLFLVTDDESGINLGYADKIGGPIIEAIPRG